MVSEWEREWVEPFSRTIRSEFPELDIFTTSGDWPDSYCVIRKKNEAKKVSHSIYLLLSDLLQPSIHFPFTHTPESRHSVNLANKCSHRSTSTSTRPSRVHYNLPSCCCFRCHISSWFRCAKKSRQLWRGGDRTAETRASHTRRPQNSGTIACIAFFSELVICCCCCFLWKADQLVGFTALKVSICGSPKTSTLGTLKI